MLVKLIIHLPSLLPMYEEITPIILQGSAAGHLQFEVRRRIFDIFQPSISSTYYVRIFGMNVVSAAFFSCMFVVKAAETTFVRKICA